MQIEARKQLVSLAKDDSEGRLTRATAAELSLEDDLKEYALESSKFREARGREELEKLKARNAKLVAAIEKRKEVIHSRVIK